MRGHLVLIAIIGLVLLAGAGSAALIPDNNSSISTSANWTVVKDKTTITVRAMNGTTAIQGATVNVALSNATLGSISMTSTKTDATGYATGTFTAGTKSGSVNITATITSGNSSITKTVTQYIDHGTPYNVQFDYNIEVTVGTETPFEISLTDYYGNPIDNKNPADAGSPHRITLHVGCSASGACAFDNSGNFVQDFTTSTDANGTATVAVRVDSVSIENIIWMKAMGAITDQYKSIISVTDAPPASIVSEITPSQMMQPCDGAANSTFTFKYTLYDKYGNTAANQSIIFHTTWPDDQDKQYTSNDQGLIWLTYGPHETAANITMTATAVANSSVTVSDSVWFYSTAPVNMLLMASPQTMGSLDSGSTIRSNVSAEVIDIAGNPVSGETVTFNIGTPTYDATYNSTYTTAPAWEGTTSSTTTGVTDADGFAIIKFKPGSFDRNASHINYNQQATGHVPVTATWTSNSTTVKRTLQLTWKNYPYLSVDTAVSPLTIALNDSVNLSIKLKGDGWALQPDPIDVDLVIDRSGSMGYDLSGNYQNPGTTSTRLYIAKAAATNFINNMTEGQDRVGLFSYSSSVTHDAALQTPYSPVKSAVSGLSASGATITRDAIKQAIDDMIAHPNSNSNAVRAIIVMTDGDWNYYGAPNAHGNGFPTVDSTLNNKIASWSGGATDYNTYYYYTGLGGGTCTNGTVNVPNNDPNQGETTVKYYSTKAYYCYNAENTEQNLSIYAADHNIRLYFIFFASTPAANSQSTLQTMANATGGYYQQALTDSDLNDAYKKIAGDLQTEAGVNTTMDVSFSNVNVSGVTFPGADVYKYRYVNGSSTLITWQDGVSNTTDQSADWNNSHSLNFNIGTITLGQTWEADMIFNLTKAGNVEVFNNSLITFNNGSDTMTLPVKYVNVIPNLSNPGSYT